MRPETKQRTPPANDSNIKSDTIKTNGKCYNPRHR